MKQEDWVQYQKQAGMFRLERVGQLPKTKPNKAEELRAEVRVLAGRIKVELLAELKIEVDRLIAMETEYGNGNDHISERPFTAKITVGN